ncbi:hypothetical protein N7478_003018 [Penicillium angulare]|uniref:uncharacterized protein n=1 Tax=Penicillium angulare TaxID=116970 RepID=UPI0025413E22|nr:uncharacterized protein N7478_003018 [Penicillium angulare]KAJ5287332.1 hypothetical protein N7478_003018 [Penicillium angulare]
MNFITCLNLVLVLATGSIGSPIKRTQEVEITFIGAADAQFSQSFPTDGSMVSISNVLSISHVSSADGNVQCTFNGIDSSVTTINGAETVDVGPPQTQISGSCHLSDSTPLPPTEQVQVTFIGAADGEFMQSFPVGGGSVQISNPLSISHIETDVSGFVCTFYGVDSSITTVSGAELVDVGPPQTQVSGTCESM